MVNFKVRRRGRGVVEAFADEPAQRSRLVRHSHTCHTVNWILFGRFCLSKKTFFASLTATLINFVCFQKRRKYFTSDKELNSKGIILFFSLVCGREFFIYQSNDYLKWNKRKEEEIERLLAHLLSSERGDGESCYVSVLRLVFLPKRIRKFSIDFYLIQIAPHFLPGQRPPAAPFDCGRTRAGTPARPCPYWRRCFGRCRESKRERRVWLAEVLREFRSNLHQH